MARRKTHAPLDVLINNRLVGRLRKAASGAVSFQYDQSWLDWSPAFAISLSLPLRETAYGGEPVVAVFDSCPTFIVSRSANGGRLWCGIETSRIYWKSMALRLCLIAGAQVMAAALRFVPIDFPIEATDRD